MKRAALERNHCRRQANLAVRRENAIYRMDYRACLNQIIGSKGVGFYRKRKAMDCGCPRCYVCHSDKYPIRNNGKAKQAVRKHIQEQL